MQGPITEPVKRALERQRQVLDESLDPRKLVDDLLATVGATNIMNAEGRSEAANDLGSVIARARELGALDQVCAQYGGTA